MGWRRLLQLLSRCNSYLARLEDERTWQLSMFRAGITMCLIGILVATIDANLPLAVVSLIGWIVNVVLLKLEQGRERGD